MKRIFIVSVLLVCSLVFYASYQFFNPDYAYLPAKKFQYSLERFEANPVISSEMLKLYLPEDGYNNINNPTVIKVPEWVEDPLGAYYMYFSHHKGVRIRLAYADSPLGPWKLYDPGALHLRDSGLITHANQLSNTFFSELWNQFSIYILRDYLLLLYQAKVLDQELRDERGINEGEYSRPHIASPEIVIDNDKKEILLIFHGMVKNGGQSSRMAVSKNGIDFTPLPQTIFSPYLRYFKHQNKHFFLGMPGVLYRSDSFEGPYEVREKIIFEHNMRHASLKLKGDVLHVFWSRVSDAPESILWSEIDLSNSDWNQWMATQGQKILSSEEAWEGVNEKVEASMRGEIDQVAHELRDPFVFQDGEQGYLYYVGGGEQAIGVARFKEIKNEN